jgi:hypothetical protein
VIFGDKSHFNLHGSLSTLPITFTLTCFNKGSRNKEEFRCPLAFLPNLSYGALSAKNSKKPSKQSYQDEYYCLHVALSSLQKSTKMLIGSRDIGRLVAMEAADPETLLLYVHMAVVQARKKMCKYIF